MPDWKRRDEKISLNINMLRFYGVREGLGDTVGCRLYPFI